MVYDVSYLEFYCCIPERFTSLDATAHLVVVGTFQLASSKIWDPLTRSGGIRFYCSLPYQAHDHLLSVEGPCYFFFFFFTLALLSSLMPIPGTTVVAYLDNPL